MFRLQNNVPEVYVNESRDFQLLCRLYDSLQNGIKYEIDTILNLLEPSAALDEVLELLCTRVGFFPKVQLDSNVLKYIISAFPYLIKNKGTAVGIKAAVYTILKAENDPKAVEQPEVIVTNKSTESGQYEPYMVYIFTYNDIYNRAALKELLGYVLPFGYGYTLNKLGSKVSSGDTLDIYSTTTELKVLTSRAGSVRNTPDSKANNMVGTYNMGVVVGYNDLYKDKDGKILNPNEDSFPIAGEESISNSEESGDGKKKEN